MLWYRNHSMRSTLNITITFCGTPLQIEMVPITLPIIFTTKVQLDISHHSTNKSSLLEFSMQTEDQQLKTTSFCQQTIPLCLFWGLFASLFFQRMRKIDLRGKSWVIFWFATEYQDELCICLHNLMSIASSLHKHLNFFSELALDTEEVTDPKLQTLTIPTTQHTFSLRLASVFCLRLNH